MEKKRNDQKKLQEVIKSQRKGEEQDHLTKEKKNRKEMTKRNSNE
jgi:hypothetical protein